MSKDKDQPLITRAIMGDTSAFSKLVENYQHMVYTLALKLVKRPEDAKEVAQDSFLRAYQALSTFKGDAKFSTWLYKITYNRGLDFLKKRKRMLAINDVDYNFNVNISTLENNWDSLEKQEQRQTINNAVQELSATDGILITLFYFEELSLIEIANILGQNDNAVKVKLFRARKRLSCILRRKLEPETIEGYEAHKGRSIN